MGYGTSLGTAHEDEMSYTLEKGLTDKQLADQKEMTSNESSGDFQSRFYATDASTMPLEASRKLTDALKQTGSTQVPGNTFETKLSPEAEPLFQEWKVQNAPKDSGQDYDLRGAFAAGVGPDPITGHWPDTWKKPNHPTFSDQSMYAKYAPDKAGSWEGDTYVPPKRSVIGQLTGSDGGERFQTWPERLARSAFTLPGDVLSGKVQPGSIQEIERAADLAGLVTLGPAPVAAKLADGTLGSFAGVKSKTLPKDKLYEAQNMELDAYHPDDIWDKTGFFRGADTRWRYEIPDADAKLKMDAFDKTTTINNNPNGWANTGNHGEVTETIVPKSNIPNVRDLKSIEDWTNFIAGGPRKPLTLDKVIDHPELFKAYPELATMKVEPLPEYAIKQGGHGRVSGMVSGDTIYLAPGHPEYVRSVLLHEAQHGIQHHEGFAYGGGQEQFLPKGLPQAEKEFINIKKDIEPKIREELDVNDSGLAHLKWAVTHEKEGFVPEGYRDKLDLLKKNSPHNYKRISNIVESERLLKEAKEEAFTKYQRLMGEVEARNVQARQNMTDFMRQSLPPNRTEDVQRFLQINPK